MTKEYGKPGAVVLFGFSFVWPHVKLALLHLFFYLPMTSKGRRNGNYWLAVFGKWSFTDVLVCATLVGVFKLTIDSTAREDARGGPAARPVPHASPRLHRRTRSG